MKAITLLLTLIMVVIFSDNSKAEVIWEKYDEAKDVTTKQYRVNEGEVLWNIYVAVVSEQVTMESIENIIMKPNNIADPKKLAPRTVLDIKIKGKKLSITDDQTAKTAVVENPKEDVGTKEDVKPILVKEDVPFVSAVAVDPTMQKSNADIIESGVPGIHIVDAENSVNNLRDSLEAAKARILELEEIVIDKDRQILALYTQLKEFNNSKSERGVRKQSESESKNKNLDNRYDIKEDFIVSSYYRGKFYWIVFSVLVFTALLIWTLSSALHNNEIKCLIRFRRKKQEISDALPTTG